MITEVQFIERHVFYQEPIERIRREFPAQRHEINHWQISGHCRSARERRNKLRFKLTEFNKKGAGICITADLLLRMYNWYLRHPKYCHYCGLTIKDMEALHEVPGFINKRDATRGYSLEIDRKISYLPYDNIDNLTLACYWCNNAKTDTFTENEFLQIGRMFNQVWFHRLGYEVPLPPHNRPSVSFRTTVAEHSTGANAGNLEQSETLLGSNLF